MTLCTGRSFSERTGEKKAKVAFFVQTTLSVLTSKLVYHTLSPLRNFMDLWLAMYLCHIWKSQKIIWTVRQWNVAEYKLQEEGLEWARVWVCSVWFYHWVAFGIGCCMSITTDTRTGLTHWHCDTVAVYSSCNNNSPKRGLATVAFVQSSRLSRPSQ